MVTRDSLAGASEKAFLVVLGFLCASTASAASRAPLRALLAPMPPLVAQLAVELRSAPPQSGAFATAAFDAPLLSIIAPRMAMPPRESHFDIAAELVTEQQRAVAAALDAWVRQTSNAERARQRRAVADAYAAFGYRPLWRDGAQWRDAAAAALDRLRRAGEDGLDLRGYALQAIAPAPAGTADESATKDFAISEAVVAYAAQASGARVDPQRVSRLISPRPALPEAAAILATVAAAGPQAGDRLAAYNPPHPGYHALKAKLAELREARLPEKLERYAEARSVAQDESAGRRRRPAATAERADTRLTAEIIANMERWRWLPRELGEDRIEVNIPDFELSVIRDGEVTHRARVIVGKEGTPTPVFSDAMQFIIVNPYWNVPPSILAKEMLPKHGGSLQSIAASGYEVIYRHGQPIVRQRPGEGNALGRIKFMFPNDFSVYLHDTPSRGLFSAAHRAFSHGCVRVDQPFRLAEAVLGPDSGWREERVRRLVGGSERYINLARPLPIHIEYFTATVDENGRLRLRGDLYGYSAKVRAALGLDG